jgi:mannose-1-phosphate guanylyltransferase / mannose-6-phosphate isomerase
VSSTAKVARGDMTFLLADNEPTCFRIGVKHRLENPTMVSLEVIEVPSDAHLGEDDIVRFEGRYGR